MYVYMCTAASSAPVTPNMYIDTYLRGLYWLRARSGAAE